MTTGTPPFPGPQLVDGTWLCGLASGVNNSYQYGITAAGTTQATAAQLPASVALVEVDTAASGTGVNLPPALAGTLIFLYNAGANTVTLYPAVANNPITGSQDTINGATSKTLATVTPTILFCAKNGIWAQK